MQIAEKIILCTHGYFSEKLKESAEMIAGPMDDVTTFCLLPGMEPDDLKGQIEPLLASCSAAVALVDIAGDTPLNVMARLSAQYPVTVVTGVNLPMLIEASESRTDMDYQELGTHLVSMLPSTGRVIQMKGAEK